MGISLYGRNLLPVFSLTTESQNHVPSVRLWTQESPTDYNVEEVQLDDLKKMGEVKEIADFFNMVSKKECQEFLATMRETIGAAPKGALYYKPAPYGFPLDSQDEDYNVDKETVEPDYKAIYEAYAKKERDAANAKTSAELNSGSSTARKLQSGFQIARASRSTNEINTVKVVLQKQDQDDNSISRQKTCSKVVCALKPAISAGNISRILTSNDKAQHDVASNALSWQSILENLKCYCIQHNMNPILMIPQGVDFKNPANVSRACDFFNVIDDWQKLEDEDYFQWQEFVLLYGSSVEVESDNWLEEVLLLSMETTLHSKVESDMKSLPLQKQKGAITMLCFIIKCMVLRNQEAKDVLETYLKTFDITAFPGKSAPIACLRLKAVAQAL